MLPVGFCAVLSLGEHRKATLPVVVLEGILNGKGFPTLWAFPLEQGQIPDLIGHLGISSGVDLFPYGKIALVRAVRTGNLYG